MGVNNNCSLFIPFHTSNRICGFIFFFEIQNDNGFASNVNNAATMRSI